MRRLILILMFLMCGWSSGAAAQEISKEEFLNPRFDLWPTCWFIATSTDFGVLYLRPRVSFGWGKPHTSWVGLDINPVLSISAPGGYTGLRLSIPHFDVRLGTRAVYSLNRSALDPQDTYEEDDVFIRPIDRLDPRSAYVSAEGEVTFDVPIGRTAVTGEIAATYIGFSPADKFVFEERLRVVTEPPWVGKARLGYRIPFQLKTIPFRIEPAAEILLPKGRPEPTVRAGVLLAVPLGPRVSIRGNFMATASSPDDIGFTGANFGEITLRWRWAKSIVY